MIESLGKLVNRVYPLWKLRPNCVQINTQNFCNLKCVYCNVRDGYGFNLPRGRMNNELLEGIIKYWSHKRIWSIAPFMNGEPLLEKRIPLIHYLIHKYTRSIEILDTNCSVWENRSFLVHPNLKIVRCTISAASRETYKIVHGDDRFIEAVQTFFWLSKNKFPSQELMLHFIINKYNAHEVEDYVKMFRGFKIRFFALHDGKDQVASKEASGKLAYHPPYIIEADGKRHFEILPNMPCQCWDILAVGLNGEIMQCPDYPCDFNYGNVKDTDMLEAWKDRLKNKMDNDYCRDCNVKYPNWKHIIDKYVK